MLGRSGTIAPHAKLDRLVLLMQNWTGWSGWLSNHHLETRVRIGSLVVEQSKRPHAGAFYLIGGEGGIDSLLRSSPLRGAGIAGVCASTAYRLSNRHLKTRVRINRS